MSWEIFSRDGDHLLATAGDGLVHLSRHGLLDWFQSLVLGRGQHLKGLCRLAEGVTALSERSAGVCAMTAYKLKLLATVTHVL